MPLISELVAFQIPTLLVLWFRNSKEILVFKVVVTLLMLPKKIEHFSTLIKGHPISQAVMHFRAKRTQGIVGIYEYLTTHET